MILIVNKSFNISNLILILFSLVFFFFFIQSSRVRLETCKAHHAATSVDGHHDTLVITLPNILTTNEEEEYILNVMIDHHAHYNRCLQGTPGFVFPFRPKDGYMDLFKFGCETIDGTKIYRSFWYATVLNTEPIPDGCVTSHRGVLKGTDTGKDARTKKKKK